MVLFTMKEMFSLMFIFAFVCLRSGDIARKIRQDWCQWACCLCFLLGVFWFQVLDSSFSSILSWFLYMMWENSFLFVCPTFIAVIEETVLSPWCVLSSFVINQLSIYVWIFSGLSILFHWWCMTLFFGPVLCSSKLGRVYVKAVCCHPAYLTYMQSASWPLYWTPQFYQLLFHKPHPSPSHCSPGLLNGLANGLILSRSTYSLFSTQQQRRSF